MSGKLLRKRIPGKSMDPTMTYMDDPHVVKVGDFIRDAYGYDQVASIDEAVFDNPDIRLAELIEVIEEALPNNAIIHDVRAIDEEKHWQWSESIRWTAVDIRFMSQPYIRRDTVMKRKIRGAIHRDFMRRPH